MSFLMPQAQAPAAPPPPPAPPAVASQATAAAGQAQRAAAAVASGNMGFNQTVTSSPEGAPAPMTAGKSLFGS